MANSIHSLMFNFRRLRFDNSVLIIFLSGNTAYFRLDLNEWLWQPQCGWYYMEWYVIWYSVGLMILSQIWKILRSTVHYGRLHLGSLASAFISSIHSLYLNWVMSCLQSTDIKMACILLCCWQATCNPYLNSSGYIVLEIVVQWFMWPWCLSWKWSTFGILKFALLTFCPVFHLVQNLSS